MTPLEADIIIDVKCGDTWRVALMQIEDPRAVRPYVVAHNAGTEAFELRVVALEQARALIAQHFAEMRAEDHDETLIRQMEDQAELAFLRATTTQH